MPARRGIASRASLCGLTVAVTFGLLACGEDAQGDGTDVGIVLSTTGPLAPLGVAQLEAAALAATEINDHGGVLGKPLRLVHRDDGVDEARARRVAAGLLGTVEPVMLGAVDSELTRAIAGEVVPAMLMVSASATDGTLTDYPDEGLLFRTCASDPAASRLVAERVTELGFTRAAVIYRESARGWESYFQPQLIAAGGTVTVLKGFTEGRTTYMNLVASVIGSNPEVVILDANPVDGARIVNDYLTHHGSAGVFWYFAGSLESEAFVASLGASNFTFQHEGIGPSTADGERFDHFASGYSRRNGRLPPPGTFAANMYDAVMLVALAVESSGSTDPLLLRAALPAVAQGGTEFGPQAIGAALDAARSGADIDYQGASGDVGLDDHGDTTTPYDLWAVRGGHIQITERRVPAPDAPLPP